MKTRAPDPGGPAFFSHQVGEAWRFYLDLDPPRGTALAVVCAGVEHCTPNFAIDRESFRYHCIEYVARGGGKLRLGDQHRMLSAGDVFSYSPDTPHHIEADPANPPVKYFVDFAGRQAPALLKSCGLSAGQVLRVFPHDGLVALFEELVRIGLEGRGERSTLCLKLLECIALKIAMASAPSEDSGSRTFSAYLRCRAHIEQNFLRLRSLDQIAAECRLDRAYICRLFRRYDRQSPYQFLMRLKMNWAAAELRDPEVLVKAVAAKVGFADHFHFSRVFRQILGSPPSEFRRLR